MRMLHPTYASDDVDLTRAIARLKRLGREAAEKAKAERLKPKRWIDHIAPKD